MLGASFSSSRMQNKDIKHEFIYINKLTCYFVKGMKPLENMQAGLFMTYPFKFKISPQNNLQFISCNIPHLNMRLWTCRSVRGGDARW